MTTRPPHDDTSPIQLHDDATQHQQQKRAVASGWVRAALLGQVASILLATVGGCSEGLSRQVIKRDQYAIGDVILGTFAAAARHSASCTTAHRGARAGAACGMLASHHIRFCSNLRMQGVFLPTSQSLLVYAGLAFASGGWLLSDAGRRQRFSGRLLRRDTATPTWRQLFRFSVLGGFAALALFDMEANFLLNKAYRYTSITSVTLLDCWTIPGAMQASPSSLLFKYQQACC